MKRSALYVGSLIIIALGLALLPTPESSQNTDTIAVEAALAQRQGTELHPSTDCAPRSPGSTIAVWPVCSEVSGAIRITTTAGGPTPCPAAGLEDAESHQDKP
jgi:hypothetical protein